MRGKSRFKVISIITIVSILLTLIPIRNIIIRAENKSEPSFSIDKMTVTHNPSILGEDITISGFIQPEKFEVQTVEHELVIVLDVSKKDNNGDFNKIFNPLRDGIKNFIKYNNGNNIKVKLGLVIYNSSSKIKLIKNKKLLDLYSEKHNNFDIKDYIKDLDKEDNNKNIGDSLRQAVYLLDSSDESNPNIDKTILLVAEGNTDTRRVYNNDEFCLDTTKEDVENTKLVTDYSDKNLEYTKAIGSIIKDKGYNIFTMGIGSDKETNKNDIEKEKDILRQIHYSMTGYSDLDNTNCEEKGLFLETANPSSNEEYITSIFNKIFNKISNEYYLNNESLNFQFDNDITLKFGENSIKLKNIRYTIDTATEKSIIYKADPIPFSFVIKAKKVGEQNVFKSLNINYSWKNKNQVQDLTRNLYITVQANDYPNILATLRGNTELTANPNDIITLQYDVEPQKILFNNLDFMKKEIEEVIFLVDLTQKLNNGNNAYSLLQNGINNAILDDDKLKNKKFGFVGYSDKDYYIGDDVNLLTQNDSVIIKNPIINELKSPLFKIDNAEGKNDYRILYQGGKISISDNNNRNIDNALIKTIDVFDKFGDDNKGKAIVLVTTDSVLYTDEVVNKIKNKGYKIISLDISANKITNIQEFYKKLGGIVNDDYIIGKFDGQNYNEADNDMAKVGERLKGGVVDKNKFITPKFTFDLNNNFEYVEASNDNISLVSNKDNKLEFTLNKPIEYRYSGEMVDGKYKFIADEQTISFKVKVKDSKLASLTFGSNDSEYLSNYMSYNNFSKEEVKVKLTTPVVKLIQKVSNVSHGLYNGIANDKVYIKENENTVVNGVNNPLILAEKSTLVMGSTFNTSSNNIDVSLNIDDNFEVVKASDIIVYKVINNNGIETIEKVGEEKNSGSYTVDYINEQTNKIKISINDFNSKNEDTKILIVYKGTIKDNISNEMLTNKIEFGNGPYKDFSIKVNKEINTETEKLPKLPDLF